ncbi:metal cation symporter ZIP14-like [Bacillus rossius redtenbacheri]|uniref:metal cation symporter ZIP14-like n=1 Tax=Bacillus rossius redtenbacheri TaxID=93214 RepID=UPI002FDEE238
MWRIFVLTACVQELVAVNYTVQVYAKANTSDDVSLAEMKDALKEVIKCRVPCGWNVSTCVNEGHSWGGLVAPGAARAFDVRIVEEEAGAAAGGWPDAAAADRPSALEVWGFGLVSVAVISLSGLGGGVFMPFIHTKYYLLGINFFLGLGAGSLTATATLQLIPEAFRIMDYVDHYINISLSILGCIWTLYLCQNLSKVIFHTKEAPDLRGPDRDQSGSIRLEEDSLLTITTVRVNGDLEGPDKDLSSLPIDDDTLLAPVSTTKVLKSVGEGIAPLAMMIIIGDGIHNFMDGMSIGAGYAQNVKTGMGLAIAVACEEFPHELGDFAILISSGMPVKKALLYNFLSACTIYFGLAVGIMLGEFQVEFIFAFAGGLFLYVALTGLFPELSQMLEDCLKKSRRKAFWILLLQCAGTMTGITILYLVTAYS